MVVKAVWTNGKVRVLIAAMKVNGAATGKGGGAHGWYPTILLAALDYYPSP